MLNFMGVSFKFHDIHSNLMCVNIWSSKHGIAKILLPVPYPLSVEPKTPFDIRYTVKNVGNVKDTIYGYLMVKNRELPGSRWSVNLPVNGTITKNYRHPGINVPTSIVLRAGYS